MMELVRGHPGFGADGGQRECSAGRETNRHLGTLHVDYLKGQTYEQARFGAERGRCD